MKSDNCSKRNLCFGVLLAPYRVDFYNTLYSDYDFDIYFELKGIDGQLFSSDNLTDKCLYVPEYLEPIWRRRNTQTPNRTIIKGLRKIIRNKNPEIVMVPEFSLLTLEVILIKILYGYKYRIVSLCDDSINMLEDKGFSVFHDISRKMCLPFIDELILLDKRARDWYRRKYHKGIWMPLIQNEKKMNGYSLSIQQKVNELKDSYNLRGRKTLLFVGRLVDEKNLPILFEACTKLKIPYKLIIVGDGYLRTELQQLAIDSGINIEFAGQKNGEELEAWYYAADVFILPSRIEAFGAVTNEALLRGCPCVVSKAAGSSCIIEDGINGYIADEKSPADIADKIEKTYHIPSCEERKSLMKYRFDECLHSAMDSII